MRNESARYVCIVLQQIALGDSKFRPKELFQIGEVYGPLANAQIGFAPGLRDLYAHTCVILRPDGVFPRRRMYIRNNEIWCTVNEAR